jgi:hypothetical protein
MAYYQTGSQAIDDSNFLTKFKSPILTEQIRISCNSSSGSKNNLYQTFTLPIIGDFATNFQLHSDYILKGILETALHVDTIANYVDSVNLSINGTSNAISKIDGINQIEYVHPYVLQSQSGFKSIVNLDFTTIPLLMKITNPQSYLVGIKFKQPPPCDYELVYDVMFTGDKEYGNLLKKEEFSIIYNCRHLQTRRQCELHFKNGHVSLKNTTNH